MDSGRVGRGVVVEYFKKFALYGISLATPVWSYEYVASSPLPGLCVGSCTKPLWTTRLALLLFPLRGDQSGKTLSWQRWLKVFRRWRRIVIAYWRFVKDKQKLDGFRSTLNTVFLKHRLWFVRHPLQTFADLGILLCLKACKLRYVAGLRLPSCLYHGLPQFDGHCEPAKWFWSVSSKYDSISTVSLADNPRYSLDHLGHTGSRTHPTSSDWYQLLHSVLKAQW